MAITASAGTIAFEGKLVELIEEMMDKEPDKLYNPPNRNNW